MYEYHSIRVKKSLTKPQRASWTKPDPLCSDIFINFFEIVFVGHKTKCFFKIVFWGVQIISITWRKKMKPKQPWCELIQLYHEAGLVYRCLVPQEDILILNNMTIQRSSTMTRYPHSEFYDTLMVCCCLAPREDISIPNFMTICRFSNWLRLERNYRTLFSPFCAVVPLLRTPWKPGSPQPAEIWREGFWKSSLKTGTTINTFCDGAC